MNESMEWIGQLVVLSLSSSLITYLDISFRFER